MKPANLRDGFNTRRPATIGRRIGTSLLSDM
jgi:hypothetical protein